jgi:hypothetical protein
MTSASSFAPIFVGRPPLFLALLDTGGLQKKLVTEAASTDDSDVAAWVRPILLAAAEKRLAKEDKRGK